MARTIKPTTTPKPTYREHTSQSSGKTWQPKRKDGHVYYVTLDGETVQMPESGAPVSVVRGATLFPESIRSKPKQ